MKPNDILITIPFSTGDAIQAERLCDWIYLLSGNKQFGHCLLAADSEVHAELYTRVKIAAEIAFETVHLFSAPKTDRINKVERMNNLFRTTSWVVAKQFRLPWLWLEPDCVPLKPEWHDAVADAYHLQPRRYMGGFLKITMKDQQEQIVLSRISVYPVGAAIDMDGFFSTPMPFNFAGAGQLTDRATKSKLFQQIGYNHETDYDKIRPDAVLLHTDKTGNLIQHLRAKLKATQPVIESVAEAIAVEPAPQPKRRGRPPIKREVKI